MDILSTFTPQEIAELVKGNPVNKTISSGKQSSSPTSETKEESGATSYTPRFSVPISDRQEVTRPNIYDQSGKRVSPDGVVGISPGKLDAIDRDLYAEKAKVQAEHDAAQELRKIASPEQLLNQLNAQRRVIEKLQREVNALKKAK